MLTQDSLLGKSSVFGKKVRQETEKRFYEVMLPKDSFLGKASLFGYKVRQNTEKTFYEGICLTL